MAICDDFKAWQWPEDVKRRFDRQPVNKADPKPEPETAAPAEKAEPDEADYMMYLMWGGL